jgi:hypothetical protein
VRWSKRLGHDSCFAGWCLKGRSSQGKNKGQEKTIENSAEVAVFSPTDEAAKTFVALSAVLETISTAYAHDEVRSRFHAEWFSLTRPFTGIRDRARG